MTKHNYEVAVLGAGPYGLSAAAHLCEAGIDTAIFGRTFEFWKKQMPQGMLLRSSWDASHISDPHKAWTLNAFQQARYSRLSRPIQISDFIRYGDWFQDMAVPNLDPRRVRVIRPNTCGFSLELEDREEVQAKRVVVAAGVGPFAYTPPQFAGLPASLVSHSADHHDLSQFAGRRVIVVGCGQSATESAALLAEAGVKVEIIARAPAVRWLKRSGWLHTKAPGPIRRLLYPPTDVGPPGLNQIVSRPDLFRKMPAAMQSWVAYRSIRPAAAGWLASRLSRCPITLGRQIQKIVPKGREVIVYLDDGKERRVDHILLATGYRVDIRKFGFLSGELVSSVRQVNGYPILSDGMETSVPGLHFLGALAAISYGPLMRFVSGTHYSSHHLTRRLISGPH